MTYDHAVLGENLEQLEEEVEGARQEKERLENRQASKKVMDRIRPMPERKRQMFLRERD